MKFIPFPISFLFTICLHAQGVLPSVSTKSKGYTEYTGEYTNPYSHVSFQITIKNEKLYLISLPLKETYLLVEKGKDIFVYHEKKYLFQRSQAEKKIISVLVQAEGQPDIPFVRIK